MGHQLALFGALAAPSTPAPLAALTNPPAASELESLGQLAIFNGPHRQLRAVEAAVGGLDAARLREAAAEVRSEFPRWPVREWLDWAEGLTWLLGTEDAPLDGAGQCARAEAILDDETARGVFPGLGGALLAQLRVEASARACEALIAEAGPLARLGNGQAAGTLPLRAGAPARAVSPLRRALGAGLADGHTRCALGEALRATGAVAESLAVFRDALLLDPANVDEQLLPTTLLERLDRAEDLELRGERRAWVPALCDLDGALPLPVWVADDPPFGPAGAFSAALAGLRRARAAGAPSDEQHEHKRRMLAAAPALRERIRAL